MTSGRHSKHTCYYQTREGSPRQVPVSVVSVALYKAKENRELGLPRKAILKSKNLEITAERVENGKIFCTAISDGEQYSQAFDLNEIELC